MSRTFDPQNIMAFFNSQPQNDTVQPMITRKVELIPQYPTGFASFNRKIITEIAVNGIGCDKLYLKITLPDLPNGIRYNELCIYDLIQNLSLKFNKGSEEISFTSTQLKLADLANRNKSEYEAFIKFITIKDNIVTYPLDLANFFATSYVTPRHGISSFDLFINPITNTNLDLDYHGFRIVDSGTNQFILRVTLGSIFDLLDLSYSAAYYRPTNGYCVGGPTNIELSESQIAELRKLELSHFETYVAYLCDTKAKYDSRFNIKQNISVWTGESEVIKMDITNVYKLQIPIDNYHKITKLILNSKSPHKIISHCIQLNGINLYQPMNLSWSKQLYEYKNNITLSDDIYICDLDMDLQYTGSESMYLILQIEPKNTDTAYQFDSLTYDKIAFDYMIKYDTTITY